MHLLNFENVMTYSASALALGWIVTFASARYEDFINWRRRKQETKPMVKFTLPSTSAPKPPSREPLRRRLQYEAVVHSNPDMDTQTCASRNEPHRD